MTKKVIAIFIALILVLPMFAGFYAEAAPNTTRVINLVYDDSMSMIRLDETKEYVDTWSQAKYAMETFAAMLTEGDMLNIYYMSENPGSENKGAGLSFVGSSDSKTVQSSVNKIHSKVTLAGNTPVEAVEQAYSDLSKLSNEERWLVVLTDGVLESGGTKMTTEAVEKKLSSYTQSGIKVMYLAMGTYAEALNGNKESGFYCKKAANSGDIRKELTDACNIIFQRNTLKSNFLNGKKFNFDVPMSQLIVFAQGENINIISVVSPDGTAFSPSSNVSVKSADKSLATTENYSTWIEIDKINEPEKMSGSVATFDAPANKVFEAGEYTVDVSGSVDSLEVYYMPEIDVQAYLYDEDGDPVDADNIVEGTYTLNFGFVDKQKKPLKSSELLGTPMFEASYINTPKGGEASAPVSIEPGVPIMLKEGSVKFTVDVYYLEFIKHAELNHEVFFDGGLTYTFSEKPVYTLTTKGMTNIEMPLVLTVQLNAGETLQPLNEIQWAEIPDPTIKIDGDFGETKIEKTERIGVYKIYISMKNGDPFETSSGQIPIKITGSFESGLSKASGKLEDTFDVNTTITSKDEFLNWLEENWIKLVISLAVLVVLIGYIPGVKKYLPKRLKKRPVINCIAESVTGQDMIAHGKYKKDTVKTLIPYLPETGSITVSPSPVKKTLRVRAKGSGMMYVTNVKSFAGKDNVLFGGTPIDKDAKKIIIDAGETITVLSPEFTYTCTPNQ